MVGKEEGEWSKWGEEEETEGEGRMGKKKENEGEDEEAEDEEKKEEVVVMGVCGVGEGDWIKKEVENLEER